MCLCLFKSQLSINPCHLLNISGDPGYHLLLVSVQRPVGSKEHGHLEAHRLFFRFTIDSMRKSLGLSTGSTNLWDIDGQFTKFTTNSFMWSTFFLNSGCASADMDSETIPDLKMTKSRIA